MRGIELLDRVKLVREPVPRGRVENFHKRSSENCSETVNIVQKGTIDSK